MNGIRVWLKAFQRIRIDKMRAMGFLLGANWSLNILHAARLTSQPSIVGYLKSSCNVSYICVLFQLLVPGIGK